MTAPLKFGEGWQILVALKITVTHLWHEIDDKH